MEFYRKYLLCINKTSDQKNKLYDCIFYKDLESENNNREKNINHENAKISLGSIFK
jgi:hypothetical protein